jgi:hypothetical protein
MDWARLMKRVFEIDVLECPRCGSRMQRIAFLTDSAVVQKILRCLNLPIHAPGPDPPRSPGDFGEEAVA